MDCLKKKATRAISKGNIKVIKQLLRDCKHQASSSNVKTRSNNSKVHFCEYFLHFAAREGYADTIRFLLINHKVSIDAKSEEDDKTALHLATENEHKEIVQLLLQHGANIEAKTANDEFALTIAAIKGLEDIVSLLLNHGANNSAVGLNNALQYAAELGHDKIAKLLLDRGAQANLERALFLAAKRNYGKVISLLLKHGVTPNAFAFEGSALLIAVEKGHKNIVNLLLDNGADVNLRHPSNFTALHIACLEKNLEIVELLVNRGANVHDETDEKFTALHYATTSGCDKIVKFLLNSGAGINASSIYGKTPLFVAVSRGYDVVVKLLINNGADVNIEDISGTCLIAEAVAKEPQIAKYLVMHAILMKSDNLYVSEKNLVASEGNGELKAFQASCEREIECMKAEKFNDCTLSCHDILKTKSLSHLAALTRNECIVQFLETCDVRTKYPIYGHIISENFSMGLEHRILQDKVNTFFHYLSVRKDDKLPKLPFTCVHQIFIYLSVEDVRNLMP